MKRNVTSAFIISAAIVIAAVSHALIVRDVGRYKMINDHDIFDTRTGEKFEDMGDDYKSQKLIVR